MKQKSPTANALSLVPESLGAATEPILFAFLDAGGLEVALEGFGAGFLSCAGEGFFGDLAAVVDTSFC